MVLGKAHGPLLVWRWCCRGTAAGPPLFLPGRAMQQLMHQLPCLLQAVCLDPRYAGRKTHELVYGTAAGALALSSKVGGWVGGWVVGGWVGGWLPPLCPLLSLLLLRPLLPLRRSPSRPGCSPQARLPCPPLLQSSSALRPC